MNNDGGIAGAAGSTAGAAGGAGAKGGAGGTAGSLGGAGGKAFTCPNASCKGSTPICDVDAGSCVGCNEVAGSCGSPDGGGPFCLADAGTMTGMCVGCRTSKDCLGTTPICDLEADAGASRNACRACTGTADCTALNPMTPVCATSTTAAGGAKAGMCVACLSNANCGGKTPICDLPTNVCVKCGADTDCSAVSPSICMNDGHCATDAEVIYVRNDMATTATCNDNPTGSAGGANAGTKAHPFCSMQPIPGYVSANRDLVLVDGSSDAITGGNWTYTNQAQSSPLTIVGLQSPTIGSVSSPAFAMSSGSVYIRAVTFQSISSNGVYASGGTLNLSHVLVSGCKGGIFLNGAAFDIENTTVNGNTTATDGTTSWSGIYVKALPDAGGFNLNLVTITNNSNVGLLCGGSISASGVYASGNQGGNQIVCGSVSSCTSPGTSCGAQQ